MDVQSKATITRTPLPQVIAANGWFSMVSGGITAATAAPLGDVMELPPAQLIAIGLALLGYGAALLAASRCRPFPLLVARLATTGDLAWVVGAIVLVLVPGTMSGSGKALLAMVSAAVLGFAVAQLHNLAAPPQ